MKKILAFSLIPALFGFFLPDTWPVLKSILIGISILVTSVAYLEAREYVRPGKPHLLFLTIATIVAGFILKNIYGFGYINIFYACYIVMLIGSWFLLMVEDA